MSAHRPMSSSEIAVIGMAGRFPGAAHIPAYFDLIASASDGLSRFDGDDRVRVDRLGDMQNGPRRVHAKGILEHADCFDADFFGISHRDARTMDPQHRVFLEAAWNAMEDACLLPGTELATGVFASCGLPLYLLDNLRTDQAFFDDPASFSRFVHNDKDFLATRVAWHLGLQGPAMSVQTGCSSSLVAVATACTSLLTHQCDVAIAGGVSVTVPLIGGYTYRPGGIMSPDGVCRPFDARAAGTVPGNGVGAIVLKRLDDALEAGDPIHAIIRGFCVNNDGRERAGFTAPGVRGQAHAIRVAHAFAGIRPGDVGYVEGHGTATPIGDPIEVTALNEAFEGAGHRCILGSAKGNIGHLDTAAGIAGLIRAILAVREGVLLPTAHFSEPNPEIPFDNGPFEVIDHARDWSMSGPRIAGVSAFGIGGTNAHVVVEEPPIRARSPLSSGWSLLQFSARTAASVTATAARVVEQVSSESRLSLLDVEHTLRAGRRVEAYRTTSLVRRTPNGRLEVGPQRFEPVCASASAQAVFLFPGQGVSLVGIGTELHRSEPTFGKWLDFCAEVFAAEQGVDLRRLMFDRSMSQADQPGTRLLQPALFAFEVALANAWIQRGVEPTLMLGHSIGELAAATIAGVFDVADAMRLVALRGQLMQQMAPGSMTVVRADRKRALSLCGRGIEVAAENSKASTTFSGSRENIAAFEKRLKKEGLRFRRLNVDFAYHSAAVEPLLETFIAAVANVSRSAPRRAVVSSVTGAILTDAEACDPNYWGRHLRATVCFETALGTASEIASPVFVEVGPGETLTRMAASQLGPSAVRLATLGDGAETGGRSNWMNALGRAWSSGLDIRWPTPRQSHRRRVSLPGRVFERRRFWAATSHDLGSREPSRPITLRSSSTAECLLQVEVWEPDPAVHAPHRRRQAELCIVVTDGGFDSVFHSALIDSGREPVWVGRGHPIPVPNSTKRRSVSLSGPDPSIPIDEWSRLLDGMISPATRSVDAVFLHHADEHKAERPPWEAAAALSALGAALAQRSGLHMRLLVVGHGVFCAVSDDAPCASSAAIAPACLAIQQSCSRLTATVVDCNVATVGIDRLVPELDRAVALGRVAWRAGKRLVPKFRRLRSTSDPLPIRQSGVYVITGGCGGVGLALAGELARRGADRIILTRRLGPSGSWTALRRRSDIDLQLSKGVAESLDSMIRLGTDIVVEAADVTNLDAMTHVLECWTSGEKPLRGVVHAAGIFREVDVAAPTARAFEDCYRAKVSGTKVILDAIAGHEPDFVAICSSIAAHVPAVGNLSYACANSASAAIALASGIGVIKVIDWDGWSGVGMAAGRGRGSGLLCDTLLTSAEATLAFVELLAVPVRRVIVSRVPVDERLAPLIQRQESSNVNRPVRAGPEPVGVIDTIRRVFCHVLGVDEIDPDDDFFDRGGDSLSALDVVEALHEALGTRLAVHDLMRGPSAQSLAAFFEPPSTQPTLEETLPEFFIPLVDRSSGATGTRGRVFLFHPIGGTLFQYRPLARLLSRHHEVIGVRPPGMVPGESLPATLDGLAGLYANSIQRQGLFSTPCMVGGHSMGGTLAFAVAHHLRKQGCEVAGIVMLDAPASGELPPALASNGEKLATYLNHLSPRFLEELVKPAAQSRHPRPHDGRGAGFEQVRMLVEHFAQLMDVHEPRPSAVAPILYLRARDRSDRPERPWIDRATHGIEVHVVDGNHLTMVHEPHVHHVSRLVGRWLERTRPSR